MRSLQSLALVLASLAAASTARAQVPLGGGLSDSTTGPLQSGVVYTIASGISVNPGQTLTIQPGAILKFSLYAQFNVYGTLVVNGAAGNPVYLTDIKDDSVGGDTNNDGPSVGAPGGWFMLRCWSGSDASVIDYAVVRYAGEFGWAPVNIESSLAFKHSIVEWCDVGGISLGGGQIHPTISNCTIRNNNGAAISGARLDAVDHFANNTATGNTANIVSISNGAIAQDTTLTSACGINGVLVVATVDVPGGRTLTLGPGVILKISASNTMSITGTLLANGISGQPVVFTSYTDDAYGGDSNTNGPSSGTPGSWIYMRFYPGSSASRLTGAVVRYGGGGGWPGVFISDSNVQFTTSIIENCGGNGIDLSNTGARPVINRCLIRNNGGAAIGGAQLGAVPFITRNTATGNGANQLSVVGASLTEDVYIDGNVGVNGATVMSGTITIPAGRVLTLGPGAVFKMPASAALDVNGSLIVHATEASPAIFTDRRDDTVGGDSDGAGGAPVPGGWFRVEIAPTASVVDVEHLVVRYAGSAGFAAVHCQLPSAVLRHCRVEYGGSGGFHLQAAARVESLTAWSCGGAGFSLTGGTYDLRHATANSCSTGILKSGPTWSGSVVDSIAWGNTTNFSGVSLAQVRYSDGFVGGTGNINADPLLANPAAGDLHLTPTSPCIAAGDAFSPVDSDCSHSDMGAYAALSIHTPTSYCTGKLNSAGCTPFVGSSGFASASSSEPFTVRAFSVLNQKNGLFFYGSTQLGAPFQGGFKCVADPVKRLPIQSSGGNVGLNDCSGVFAVDFNAVIQAGTDPALSVGATVDVQCWYRDPAVFSATGLSNALQFEICN